MKFLFFISRFNFPNSDLIFFHHWKNLFKLIIKGKINKNRINILDDRKYLRIDESIKNLAFLLSEQLFYFRRMFFKNYGPASVNKSSNFLAMKLIPKDFNKKDTILLLLIPKSTVYETKKFARN
jgi:hypothetical protein